MGGDVLRAGNQNAFPLTELVSGQSTELPGMTDQGKSFLTGEFLQHHERSRGDVLLARGNVHLLVAHESSMTFTVQVLLTRG
jgi:hypothetical protein